MRILSALTAIAMPLAVSAQNPPLEEIVVTADFREQAASDLPASISVLDRNALEQAGVQHLESVMMLAPNLNWSGETSRPRFLQIRGIGEREQYQGAPNPSVGFVIDDIDFSGIGMVATLFDVDQIEVLRGPQSTRYGSNALAGMVNVETRGPEDEFSLNGEIELGSDDMAGAGIAVGGPVAAGLSYRVAAQRYRSDGFRDNEFLQRSDTNARDELTARAKLDWAASSALQMDLTAMHVDIDNGYDAWVNDNGFTTRSDKPGKDAQRSNAFAAKLRVSANPRFDLVGIATLADSDIEVSFDGDWGNDEYWGTPYDFTSETLRVRTTSTQELRLLSTPGAELFSGTTSWLAGVYRQELDEGNEIFELFNSEVFRDLSSEFESRNLAIFGQLDFELGDRVGISTGLRFEQRDADYADSDAVRFSPSESMSGGHLSVTYDVDERVTWYGSLVRGYKAGGFNIGPSIPPQRRDFGAENLWNLEGGVKLRSADGRLDAVLGVFYSVRRDQQVSTSLQLDPGDPLSFVFFTDNAAEGHNYGLEAELAWRPSSRWSFDANVGLLRTEYERFDSPTVALSGRDQAHAPRYQFALAMSYRRPSGYFARLDFQGRDSFYFDDSHDQQSEAYELTNLRVGYESGSWAVSFWVRNLFDEEYAVRGFYFSNDPNDPSFTPELFVRLGDPRQLGVTTRYNF
ncbi:MAG TPA: TonB-dependent receptor [Gammaproteobacteria bacterium]|jgi:outer membrane receptor protein involved in Fe transport